MFTSKTRLLRRRNRAVTLIEAVLYISIALALIVGGLVFFQQASTAAKTSTMVRQLSATLAEARVLIKGTPLTDIPTDITSFLISSGAVPPDMVASATSLSNPFGGAAGFSAALATTGGFAGSTSIAVFLTNIPQGVCARLLTATGGSEFVMGGIGPGGTTLVSSGYIMGGVFAVGGGGAIRTWILNPTQAGWMCKYGSHQYDTQNSEPASSTPLSGNLNIVMVFLADA